MSFDSPGSVNDPKAWLMRVLMFLPILILLIALIWSFVAYSGGNYKRSVIINSTLAGAFIVLFASLGRTGYYQP
jgi:branched-subunit amino acid transport protein